MSFPMHGLYIDSGIPWLGDIPSHWRISPFKRLIDRNDSGVWGEEPVGVGDTIVLRSTEQTVDGHWQIDAPATRKLSLSEEQSTLLEVGDLLLTKSSGSSFHIGKTTLVSPQVAAMRCCYSNFMQRIRTKSSLLPKFAWYILNNNLARLQFDLLSNSTTGLANLNGTVVGQIILPIPPLDEQLAIASFLDGETAKIDALVAEQRRLVELLKEKRQAVISHAVTKGLDPTVPMKPSGIPWLGDVPEPWDVQRVKTVTSFVTSGPRGWSERITETGALFIQSGDLDDKLNINFEGCKRVYVENDAEAARTQLLEGDVVICVTGAKTGNVAVCKFCPETAYVNQHVCLIRPTSQINSSFLGIQLKSDLGQTYFAVSQYGLKQGLSLENVKEAPVVLPPLREQAMVVDFISGKNDKFNSLITEADRAILLLQERRTALISAAVTGKIDVRDFASTGVQT